MILATLLSLCLKVEGKQQQVVYVKRLTLDLAHSHQEMVDKMERFILLSFELLTELEHLGKGVGICIF